MFKAHNLKLLLTEDAYINTNHYFGDLLSTRKGIGVEIIFVVDDIQSHYQHVINTQVKLESELTKQDWGMLDFRLADPDGYYLRITSRKIS
ncbi:VOC family protein [Sporolactobacillus laevolacticus]